MKITQLLILAVCVCVSQFALALRIDIKNEGIDQIMVCPEWTGIVRKWEPVVGSTATEDRLARYDSGMHALRKLYVMYPNIGCFEYRFGANGFSGTGKLMIRINIGKFRLLKNSGIDSKKLTVVVSGHTDVVFQKFTEVKHTAFEARKMGGCNFSSGIADLEK